MPREHKLAEVHPCEARVVHRGRHAQQWPQPGLRAASGSMEIFYLILVCDDPITPDHKTVTGELRLSWL